MKLTTVLEALLFASDKPLTVARIQGALRDAAGEEPMPEVEALKDISEDDIRLALAALETELADSGRAVAVQEVAKGFQLRTRAETALWVGQLREGPKPPRLSPPALETLAIVAYRQPLTRADMEAIRGVAVDGVVATLLERRYIHIAGRSEQPGRPLLYETTPDFLADFGLRHLDDLPNADELRRINIGGVAEEQAAAEAGDAPAPDGQGETTENDATAGEVATSETATSEAAESETIEGEAAESELAENETAEDDGAPADEAETDSDATDEASPTDAASDDDTPPEPATETEPAHEPQVAPQPDRPTG